MLILTREYVRYQWALVIFRFVPYWWAVSLQVQIFQLFTCIQSCVFILCSQVNILVNQLWVYWVHGLLPIVAIFSMWKYSSKRLLIGSLLKRIPTAPLSLPLQARSQLRLFNWRRCIHNTIAALLLQSTVREVPIHVHDLLISLLWHLIYILERANSVAGGSAPNWLAFLRQGTTSVRELRVRVVKGLGTVRGRFSIELLRSKLRWLWGWIFILLWLFEIPSHVCIGVGWSGVVRSTPELIRKRLGHLEVVLITAPTQTQRLGRVVHRVLEWRVLASESGLNFLLGEQMVVLLGKRH